MGSQEFNLKWNNHYNNLINTSHDLLASELFVDVTLSCEGQNLKAHKLVLSSCSSFFKNVFLENPCKHPVIVLKGVKFNNLKTIVKFMYHGEVSVSSDQLTALIDTADYLQVKGLTTMCSDGKDDAKDEEKSESPLSNVNTSKDLATVPSDHSLHRKKKRKNRSTRSETNPNFSDSESQPLAKVRGTESSDIISLSEESEGDEVDEASVGTNEKATKEQTQLELESRTGEINQVATSTPSTSNSQQDNNLSVQRTPVQLHLDVDVKTPSDRSNSNSERTAHHPVIKDEPPEIVECEPSNLLGFERKMEEFGETSLHASSSGSHSLPSSEAGACLPAIVSDSVTVHNVPASLRHDELSLFATRSQISVTRTASSSQSEKQSSTSHSEMECFTLVPESSQSFPDSDIPMIVPFSLATTSGRTVSCNDQDLMASNTTVHNSHSTALSAEVDGAAVLPYGETSGPSYPVPCDFRSEASTSWQGGNSQDAFCGKPTLESLQKLRKNPKKIKWSRLDLHHALSEYAKGSENVREISRKWGIPKSTLYDHIKRKITRPDVSTSFIGYASKQ